METQVGRVLVLDVLTQDEGQAVGVHDEILVADTEMKASRADERGRAGDHRAPCSDRDARTKCRIASLSSAPRWLFLAIFSRMPGQRSSGMAVRSG
jgi:hypothetical protein